MLFAALLACSSESPTAAPVAQLSAPVATVPGEVATPVPKEPSPEALAAAAALHEEAAATDAAFAAELAGRSTRKATPAACPAKQDATRAAVWVTADRPAEAPGVRAASELLHALNPAAYAAKAEATAEVVAAPTNATIGVATADFERVRAELSSTRVFYWETEGTPPILDESANPPPGERVFTGGRSTGEAWVWDGGSRRFVCRALVTVTNSAPIATKATEKVGWDIGLAVAVRAAETATTVE